MVVNKPNALATHDKHYNIDFFLFRFVHKMMNYD